LEEVGVLLHKARSGKVIVRLTEKVDPGTIIFDEKGKKLGKITELIGPVSKPYASVVPLSDRIGKKGDRVYKR
jgi:RNA-binding protein